MRYLGVELDTRLSFTKHVQQASLKASQSALAIGRLMPNIGGPSQSKRALLGSVANSKMLYASPVWAARGTKTAKNRLAMARAQRTVALRTIRAYCTVSAENLVHPRFNATSRSASNREGQDQNTTGRSGGRNAHQHAEESGKSNQHCSLASSVGPVEQRKVDAQAHP
ncbi:uncharacterized protein LOC132948261 [Metopolophium dirhodum]|uniref:uncharacterized protein LOC132948261 n=1 Tax=Metopolophium dirhodum TaxID=44670 RepID=UPI00299035A3|nr:uncharacterized protein LOC132948261 [Metopolophium dirhodum]